DYSEFLRRINGRLQAELCDPLSRIGIRAPIARVLVMPSILAVNNEVPAKTVAELFALAKETRCNVGGATSREADNDAHRSPWAILVTHKRHPSFDLDPV